MHNLTTANTQNTQLILQMYVWW